LELLDRLGPEDTINTCAIELRVDVIHNLGTVS
jgi:hypothetical protein